MSGTFYETSDVVRQDKQQPLSRLQQSCEGQAIPVVYGKTRLSGNIIWMGDFTTDEHHTVTESGDKDVPDEHHYSYSYYVAMVVSICEGPVLSINKIWKDKSKYDSDVLHKLNLILKDGSDAQAPFYHLANHHPTQALSYPNICYVASPQYALSDQASAGNHSFEVASCFGFSETTPDANPKDILDDILTNPIYGAGFSPAQIGDLSAYSAYCVSQGIFLSPAYTQQATAASILEELAKMTNSAILWSDGKIKVTPFADNALMGNGAVFVPNTEPAYHLANKDLIVSGSGDAIFIARKTPADAFNHVQIEYSDRENDYNHSVAEAKDEANIIAYGLRTQSKITMSAICRRDIAQTVARLQMQRLLYVRNTYQFNLSWRHCLLEPMDLVTLTDEALGLDRTLVRITGIEEKEDGLLAITAEDCTIGVGSSERYPIEVAGAGYSTNSEVDPGTPCDPIIFEMPNLSASAEVRIRIAITGQNKNWGGCIVYTSLDGQNYQKSSMITEGALYGTIQTALDEHQSVDVQLMGKGGALSSVPLDAAYAMQTVCLVGNEYVGYELAAKKAQNQYTLTTPLRAQYGTDEATHTIGEQFVRINKALFESEPIEEHLIGKTIYFKFVSFNVFGSTGGQTLSNAKAYTYQVIGSGFLGTLPVVPDFLDYFKEGRLYLTWGIVTDARLLDYEIRKGDNWSCAQMITRTRGNEFPISTGDGTYFVSARSAKFYSSTPAVIAITGTDKLVSNVVVSESYASPNWFTKCRVDTEIHEHEGRGLALSGNGLFSEIVLLSTVPDLCFVGRVCEYGYVESKTEIDIGSIQSAFVSIENSIEAMLAQTTIQLSSISQDSDLSEKIKAQIEYRAWEDNNNPAMQWKPFLSGNYQFRYFAWRIKLISQAANVSPLLKSVKVTIDVPDKIQHGQVLTLNDQLLRVNFAKPFTKVPTVMGTIVNQTSNRCSIYITNITQEGFEIAVRWDSSTTDFDPHYVNWTAQGF
jgi:hypothetical protein